MTVTVAIHSYLPPLLPRLLLYFVPISPIGYLSTRCLDALLFHFLKVFFIIHCQSVILKYNVGLFALQLLSAYIVAYETLGIWLAGVTQLSLFGLIVIWVMLCLITFDSILLQLLFDILYVESLTYISAVCHCKLHSKKYCNYFICVESHYFIVLCKLYSKNSQ